MGAILAAASPGYQRHLKEIAVSQCQAQRAGTMAGIMCRESMCRNQAD